MADTADHAPAARPQQSGSSPFSRIDPVAVDSPEDEAQSVAGSVAPETTEAADMFEKRDSHPSQADGDEPGISVGQLPVELPELFDELPIELVSLTDRFIASLSAKTFSTPPSIDTLSDLFQEFYRRASSHISTHVSTLSSRLHRDSNPSLPSSKSSRRPSSSNGPQKDSPEQQMLTADEVAERRKARKLLQFKQHALEEAVERRACETVYDKIWRHRSTIDDVRDEKLRSKTAALLVMGIELKDLGVDISSAGEKMDPKECVAAARQCLIRMNEERFPLGKLQLIVAAHKAIVDVLTGSLPSSSSADEILPTLIYTLILSPPEGVNIISNLNFIQRFRASSKIDGEAAYCLTNLEAAIDFLENVDLNSLRMEEGRTPIDRPEMSILRPTPMDTIEAQEKGTSTVSLTTSTTSPATPDTRPAPSTHPSAQQRLTDLLQPPALALGAANDIVRSTADQGFKTISSTLDNSFTFLFGRLKEVQISQGDSAQPGPPIVPKTLDDARKLVQVKTGMMPPDEALSDDGSVRGDRTPTHTPTPTPSTSARQPLDDRLASLVAGRKRPGANRSDTNRSEGSVTSTGAAPASSGATSANPAFGSVRGFGTSLNPLSHIPSMIRGLGRVPETPTTATAIPRSPAVKEGQAIQKFLDMNDASDLKVGDIPELLEDYKRLAAMLRAQGR